MNKEIRRYIDSMRLKEEGSFRFSKNANTTILSSSFALSTLYLLEGGAIAEEYIDSKTYLRTQRTEKGYFLDKNFIAEDTTGSHKQEYILSQFTYFTMIALDMLGDSVPGLPFVDEKYGNQAKLEEWIRAQDFSRFWYSSNELMFVLYFLSYILKYSQKNHKDEAEQQLQLFFSILNSKQDPETGYWGTDLNNGNLLDGCYGSAHIYLFYDYYKREIPYVKQIIVNTLTLHAENGLLGNKYGGACEDYDAIDIYLRCMKQTDYRKGDVVNMLEKMRKVIGESQHRNGGFPYRISQNSIRRSFKIAMKRSYMYSGWTKMETIAYEPDLWATWFRSLSLKVIDYMIDEKDEFYSYHLPAWGYIR